MKYIIVTAMNEFFCDARTEFENLVNAMIKAGYIPQGGVNVLDRTSGSSRYLMTQAMIKN